MAITISSTEPRLQYTATGSQTSFTVNFEFFANADLKVYNGTTLLTYAASPSNASYYSVTGAGVTGGGSITLGSPGATLNDIVTIYRDMSIARSTDFPTAGAFQVDSLNTELDKLTTMVQQNTRDLKFSPRAPKTTTTNYDLTFPALGASKILSVNSGGTALEFLNTTTDVTAVATVVDEIALLGVASVITDMGILGTSAIVADMAILATTDVVADMNTLASSDFVSDLNVLATSDIVTDMNLLATSANVTAMGLLGISGVVTNMGLLGTSAVVTDMGLLGTSAVVTDMDLLATSAVITDLDLLATSANVTAMGLLGTSAVVSDLSDVADNIAGVNSFADRYRVGSSNPGSSLDEGDLFFNTSDNALKYYNGSSWASITAGIGSVADDGSPQLGEDLDVVTFDIVSTANRDISIIPNGSGDVNLGADTVQVGDNNANATLTTQGTGDLILNTNNGTNAGNITLLDGANGNITITPNGSGATVVSGSMNDTISTTGKALVMGF